MTLIKSRQKPDYKFRPGDLVGAREAAQILGYKSPRVLQERERRENLIKDFESVGCSLTVLTVGGQYRFLRSELDLFLTRKIETVRDFERRTKQNLRLVI